MTIAASLTLFGFEIPIEAVVLGIVIGLTYALLGIGLLLVYRSSRVINFAHGEMGAVAATVMLYTVGWLQLPWLIGLVAAVLAAIAVGFLIDFLVIRRLGNAPRLVVLVATIGLAQVLLGLNTLILEPATNLSSKFTQINARLQASFPVPFEQNLDIGDLRLDSGDLMILVTVPLITIGLSLFLRRSKLGLAIRASSENQEAASLAGADPRRVSILVWVLVALLAAAAAILLGTTKPLAQATGLGPNLLIRTLGAGVLGGMASLPQVFAAGIFIGVVEQLVDWNYPQANLFELVLFALIVGAIFLRKDLGRAPRGGETSSWSLGGVVHTLEPRIARLPKVRALRHVATLGLVAAGFLAPIVLSLGGTILLSSIYLFAVVGLSLTVLTGYAGQVSIGQFAFVGMAAIVGGRLQLLGDFPVGVNIAVTVAVVGGVGVIVGLPALRLRGLLLAVTTLAFSIVGGSWLMRQHWLVVNEGARSSLTLPRPTWFGVDFLEEANYYRLSLGLLVLTALVVARVRSTGFGRRLFAVRDNENAAATMSIPPRRVKLQAFVLSAVIAALGGYFYGGLLVSFGSTSLFDVSQSLALVAMVIFGGVTTVTGTILGALWVRAIPYFFGSQAGILSSGLGVLIVLQVLPGGLSSLLFRARDALVSRIAGERVGQLRISARAAGIERAPLPPAEVVDRGGEPLPLVADDITVRFGGLTAVHHVDLELRHGEIVGLVGPNGAGKTTLFDVLSGQIRATEGRVLIKGEDVTDLRPEQRARRGVGRTFQEARLYPEVSLLDTFKLALERAEPTPMIPSLFGLPPSRSMERRKERRAEEIIELLGLTSFASRACGELSTGTRRFAELGCLLAMGSDVLLLDEPTAGIAQREVEAFTPVLKEIREHLGASMVVIDHDIPMMMSLVDRIYVMAVGDVIAEGDPEQVRHDPQVIAAYLGTDERAIQRSGALTGAAGRSGAEGDQS